MIAQERVAYLPPSRQEEMERPRQTQRRFGLVHISEIIPFALMELQRSKGKSKVASTAEEVLV